LFPVKHNKKQKKKVSRSGSVPSSGPKYGQNLFNLGPIRINIYTHGVIHFVQRMKSCNIQVLLMGVGRR